MVANMTWYIARSSGIVAWLLLAGSVLWGLALSTKVLRGKPRPNWILDLHRFLGGIALVFTGVHVLAILLDRFVDVNIVNVLVPFTGRWHPVAVAWGVVGLYLLAAVEITSLLRKKLSKRAWRLTHYLSFPLFALTTAHTLSAGTDRNTFLLRWTCILVVALVVVLTGLRVRKADRHEVRLPNCSGPASRRSLVRRRDRSCRPRSPPLRYRSESPLWRRWPRWARSRSGWWCSGDVRLVGPSPEVAAPPTVAAKPVEVAQRRRRR